MTTAAAACLVTVACGGDAADANGKTQISISTFGEFGYEELYAEYERLHSDIDIVPHTTGQGGPYHQALFTKLGAGSGLDDVVAIEEAHLPEALDKSSRFHDLREVGPAEVSPGRWLDWKYQSAVDKEGRLIGYGTDTGPLAMCYRKDLFEKAGLPSEPDEVGELFATWDSYFDAGDTFVANSDGVAWFDSAAQIFNAMQNQLDVGYFDRQDRLTIESNAEIRRNWDTVTDAVNRGQSAGLVAFSNEWNSGFKQSAFATKTCPSWMLGVIEEQAGDELAGEWAVTSAFPGGPRNWGGSYLAVPTQSEHAEEAAAFAAWLTAPEQQIKAFKAAGAFPSQVEALESPELLSATNDYFGGAKIGELFAEQAKTIGEAQYKGPGDGKIQENALAPALQAVEQGASADEGWQQFVASAKQIAS
ncbi:ABC-type sugar transport system, periplasmic component [Saccharomonospora xinjiangensis XJ-54]|uniref:ABC-type sugar transport system, periplasmic component n=1 Tax=Saccharomonospora xinjiangensis XJ-54 TaxID=882086 RepID=I0V7N1_9PSEU|nr:ABC transporter substrate-binding protein [Saccharomonospora xinjiangensis]EID56134.1 ABC-type sugar transport system, periplasmic component [Saccharomonospora xinjiangensis XJ-54]